MRHRRARVRRRAALRPALLVAVLWAAATAFCLAFAAATAVGPVLLTLSPGHGVHVGDLVALVAACSAAAVLTRRVLRQA
jgi:hypothetical protein